MRLFRFTFVLLLFLTESFSQTLSDSATISLLTCGPGEELYSVFGHTAIRVHDPVSYTDRVYNYGTFDFDTPNFYLKFVKGDMQYLLSTSSYDDFVATYKYFDRDVYEQALNLTFVQKQHIADNLRNTLSSKKRFYQYKFIDRNCTTMAADDISKVTGGILSLNIKDKGLTYREILYSYLTNHFYENLGINLIFGYRTDAVSNQLFLPLQLMEGAQKTNINGKQLVSEKTNIYTSTGSNKKISLFNNFYTFSILMLILATISHIRAVHVSLLVIMGLLGLFFTFVGFYSYHAEISLNYNALLINPLFPVLLYFMIRKNKAWIERMLYLCLGCIVIYFILLISKPHIILVMPIMLLNSIMLLRLLLNNRKMMKVVS